jgi:CHAT domain-containing protein/tetratricopeptide (TPR) repeat protein
VRWWPFGSEEDRATKAHAELNDYLRIAQKETERYLRTADQATLDRAAAAWLRILAHASFPSATLERLPAMNDASGILMHRYNARGDVDDLNRALFWLEEAVKATPVTSPDLPDFLNNLGYGLLARFKRMGQDVDLEKAIRLLRQAVQATPPESPGVPGYLNNLGNALRVSYARTGLEADLEEAIAIYQQAVQATPPDSLDLSSHLNNLGTAWNDRYDQTGRQADLEEAIRLYRESLQAPRSKSSDLAIYLSNLGTGLQEQYAWTGQVKDLEEAIRVCEQAIEETPPDSPDMPVHLNGLWNCLCYQFERTGRVEDLEEAIRVIRQALHATPSDSIRMPALLSNLGTNLQDRFERIGREEDLEEAIRVFQKAMRATPSGSAELPKYLCNLGNSLLARFGRTSRPADLDEAIDLFKQAVKATPPNSPDMLALLASLGTGLRTRFARTRQVAELEEAIQVYRQAITSIQPDSASLPGYLNNLATGLGERFAFTGQEADLQEAIRAYRRACQLGALSDPQTVLGAARNWGHSAFQRKQWAEAAEAYDYGLATGRQLLARQLLREHKESWLRDLQEMSGALSYALAKMGRYGDATVVMERGRARLLGEALQRRRRDLENLPAHGHADLFQRYREIEQQQERLIQSETPRLGQRAALTGQARLRSIEVAAREFEQLIVEIRQVPNYADFLGEASFAQIQAVAANTPAVYLLATSAGGLALLVHAGKAQPIWLDSLTGAVVSEWLKGPADDPALGGWLGAYQEWLIKRTPQTQRAWFAAIDGVTRQLWTNIIEPLAVALHQLKRPGDYSVAPSVTLIPTGLLALLPLHAAWIEDASAPAGRRYFVDEFTVNYAPSALVLGHSWDHANHSSPDRLLAVEEPLAAGASNLPNVHREVAAIAGLFDNPVILAHKKATRQAVLSALPEADVVHFSCHGRNNWQSPLDSGLLMADDASGKNVMLTVRDMLDSELPNGKLATLSACETGIVGTELPDEVVALPSALLQAGYCGVAASLWSVSDISTAMLMQRFYAGWRNDNLSPAEALQFAQQWLRDSTNKEKADYFKRNSPELADKLRAPEAEAIAFFTEAMSRHMDRREFAHPFWWAAFYLTGS